MSQLRRLGASGLQVSALGVGVWSWGDQDYWGYGTTYSRADVEAAFQTSLAAGVNFFDTAEVYGRGQSEVLLGELVRSVKQPLTVATKFAPLPMRLVADSAKEALANSLARLGASSVDLYQVHWPFSLINKDKLMDVFVELHKEGKIKAIGVSNYTATQMHQAQNRLAKHGLKLASNQVHYNLLKRKPEINGVLKACRELDVALIAYSPLAQGVLTDRNSTGQAAKPSLVRRMSPQFSYKKEQIQPITNTLVAIARLREKTVEQVALNWLLCRDELVIPIPGAKNAKQAQSNAGALGWLLNEEEIAQLDRVSAVLI